MNCLKSVELEDAYSISLCRPWKLIFLVIWPLLSSVSYDLHYSGGGGVPEALSYFSLTSTQDLRFPGWHFHSFSVDCYLVKTITQYKQDDHLRSLLPSRCLYPTPLNCSHSVSVVNLDQTHSYASSFPYILFGWLASGK